MYLETATRRTGEPAGEEDFMVERMEDRDEDIVSGVRMGSVDMFLILVKTSLLMRSHEYRGTEVSSTAINRRSIKASLNADPEQQTDLTKTCINSVNYKVYN